MSQVPVLKTQHAGWPVRRVGFWLIDAWWLFRRAPVRLYALAVLPMLVEMALQMGWPGGGVVASKLVVPLFSAWALLMIDGVIVRNRVSPVEAACALWQIRRSLPGLALLSASVFVVQCIVMWCVAGPAGAKALVLADPAGLVVLSRAQLATSLATGAIPAVALLFFAGSRIVLEGMPVRDAVVGNLRLLRRNPAPMVAWMAANISLLAALVYQPWLLLLLLPMGLVGYAAWRDVYGTPSAPGAAHVGTD